MRKIFQEEPSLSIKNIIDIPAILQGVDVIYVFPHHEIKLVNGVFQQTRSGPNWEGDVVTLTTCKHLLRTYSSMVERKTALVGLTNKLDGENFIMYIGVIDKIFDSNYDLGSFLAKTSPDTFNKKSTSDNRLGDVFFPNDKLSGFEVYDIINFEDPCSDHCRVEENDSKGDPKWWKDIEYLTRNGTRPKCLIFNPVTVHTRPIYTWKGRLGRSGVVFKGDDCIRDFISNLEKEQ